MKVDGTVQGDIESQIPKSKEQNTSGGRSIQTEKKSKNSPTNSHSERWNLKGCMRSCFIFTMTALIFIWMAGSQVAGLLFLIKVIPTWLDNLAEIRGLQWLVPYCTFLCVFALVLICLIGCYLLYLPLRMVRRPSTMT